MDKIILVFYINIAKMSPRDVDEYMERVRKHVDSHDETILNYIIPIRDGDNHVECLNPKLVSEDDYAKAKEALDALTEKLKTI